MPTREFRHLATVEEAKRLFFDAIGTGIINEVDAVKIQDITGRVLARRVIARKYLPAYDISVVDGYVVRAIDLHDASSRNPTVLRLVGESRLGELPRIKVRKGETVAVATGSVIPKGGDAVVMVEHAWTLSGSRIEFRAPVGVREGITGKGEDLRPDRLVLERGCRLRAEDIGVLKALGLRTVRVVRRVRVGVLSTGNELVDAVRKYDSAKVVDLNRPVIKAMLRELGAVAVDMGIVEDDEWAIKAALRAELARTDMILVTAGSSVGKKDLVAGCINSLGRPGMVVHGIAMRPAMPTGLAVVRGKPIVSLPGFPVSAMVAFRVFVRPLLAKLVGVSETPEFTIKAVLSERVSGARGVRTFVRVKVKRTGDGYQAVPLKAQRSSILTSMMDANGIVTLPESATLIEPGTEVSVTLTGNLAT
ncbi:MAG TPA: gephyrin-like molybdotransferase Glp [Candidatus Dormibacteraeota bacterium]|nr:gephyrin-like molybdotransferase Glp [Candidatus Dormibacteraeota bacterium]